MRIRTFSITAVSAAAILGLASCTGAPAVGQTGPSEIDQLSLELSELRNEVARIDAYGKIANVFNRYHHLHNVFRDNEIITDLWVKEGTPGISAQYTNTGVYNTWDSVMEYHRDRPTPEGKLLLHNVTSPIIEVAGDGQTAKGVWTIAGVESGLASAENADKAPQAFFEPGEVNGKRVWAHWVFVRYHVDFQLQDGEWKMWHLRVVEIARAPYSRDWITFAEVMENVPEVGEFHNDILYFGDDGEVVFYPDHDDGPKSVAYGYRTTESMEIEPPLPEPYETFEETTEY